MDVRLPDGTVITGVPDGMSKAEFTNRAIANGYAKALGGTDTSAEAPSPTTGGRILEGIGQGFSEIGRGVKQRLGMMGEGEVAEARKVDQPLLATGAGMTGSVIGQGLPAVAASMLAPPTLLGAAGVGAGFGALAPTVAGEDVGVNAIKGGLFGAGGHTLGRAITGPIVNRNPAPRQDLIDLAKQKYDITLPASTQTGSKPLAFMESQLATSFGGGRMGDLLERGPQQYARAVMGEAGAPGQLASTAGWEAAHKGTQQAFAKLWATNTVKADNQLLTDFIAAQDLAKRALEPGKQAVVKSQIDNILDKVGPNGEIDGSIYQMFLRPEVRSVAAGDSALKAPLKMVQKALDDAAVRSLNIPDNATRSALNYQYAVQKAIKDRVGPAEARGGTFAPSDMKVVAGDFKGNMGELARIGPLLREPPQSGTVPRAMSEALLRGALPGAAGAYGYQEGGLQGAGAGALAGLLAPAVASRLIANKPAQAYLAHGLLNASPRSNAAITALIRAGAIPLPRLLDAPQQ